MKLTLRIDIRAWTQKINHHHKNKKLLAYHVAYPQRVNI